MNIEPKKGHRIGKWEVLDVLGSGGQGKVYRAANTQGMGLSDIHNLHGILQHLDDSPRSNDSYPRRSQFRDIIVNLAKSLDTSNLGALKLLHQPADARDPERAKERIKRELQAMTEANHPNLIKVLDQDSEAQWFVTEFHQTGSLDRNIARYTGDFVGALRAFIPLAEGVAQLHEKGIVHRDIKPHNVFIAGENRLVLGDFGLVFFEDDKHMRISGTFENVGTRDWMPPWTMGMRIDEVRPSFDVFALGKLLWAMVSKIPVLQLWYWSREKWDLKRMFPNAQGIELSDQIFEKTIVENETDCLPTAGDLVKLVRRVLQQVQNGSGMLDLKVERKCRVCGDGNYIICADRNPNELHNFGLQAGNGTLLVFACSNCGHVQFFKCKQKSLPPAWRE
ncbi:MAG: protein kinase [Verrucomicrobiia bacterium]